MKNQQKIKNKQHIQLSLADEKVTKFDWTSFLLYQLIFISLSMIFISMFQFTENFTLAFMLVETVIVLLHIESLQAPIKRTLKQSMIGLLLLLFILAYSYFMNGFFIFYDQITTQVSMHTGKVFDMYEVTVSDETAKISVQIFSIYVFLVFYFITKLLVKLRSNWLLLLIVFVVISLQITLKLEVNLIVQTLFFAMFLLSFMLFHLPSTVQVKGLFTTMAIFVGIFAVFFITMFLTQPATTYDKASVVKSMEDKIRAKQSDMKYEKEKTNNFTEGNFRRLEALQLEDETALEIVMTDPMSMYLRGFVGADYQPEGWEEVEAKVYHENYAMLYWLNEKSFHPLQQLSVLNDLVAEDESDKNKVIVQNKAASSKYLYTPHELSRQPEGFAPVFAPVESTFIADGFFGQRSYDFQTSEKTVTKYPTLANALYANRKDENMASYSTYESYYNEFVYDTYRHVPDNVAMMLETHLGKVSLGEEETHVPYEWAIDTITTYLEDNIAYDMDVGKYDGEQDFLMHLLENERKGFATHFATAATMMFRYFQIPARYVEGYLVTPEAVHQTEAYEKIFVQGTDAHAWTEIYIDEIGWIPVEVTPAYKDVMEKVDLSNYPVGDNETDIDSIFEAPGASFNDGKQEIQEEEQIEDVNNEPKEKLAWFYWLLILVGLLFLLALMIYLIYLIRRRLKLKQFIQSFTRDKPRRAIPRMFSYVTVLLAYDGVEITGGSVGKYLPRIEGKYGEEYGEQFEKAWKLNQEVIYSKKEMTQEEVSNMKQFYEKSLQVVLKDKGRYERFKMKYVDFVYDQA